MGGHVDAGRLRARAESIRDRSFTFATDAPMTPPCADGTRLRPVHTGLAMLTLCSAMARDPRLTCGPSAHRRSENVRSAIQTQDRFGGSVTRVPSAPPPDWVIARRRLVGDRIRNARRDQKLTQEMLAELAGLDRQSINRIEQAHASPLLDNLFRIADALDIPLSDLVR